MQLILSYIIGKLLEPIVKEVAKEFARLFYQIAKSVFNKHAPTYAF